MAKNLQNKQPGHKTVKRNNASSDSYLHRVRKRIYRQAILALLTIVLTIVILFAMTSAWYTNIVQTSGLVFEAEAWGFDGVITVNNAPVSAAPGDDGVVHLTVENNSDTISAISVNISKTGMEEEMQRRLFFYVDTRMNRNGETMERVYLNKTEGYTYNVFSKGQLKLTEQISNAPVIKWEWVYDVLGYYVLAQPQTIVHADGTTTTKMNIKEYLRPIEYDFDEATTAVHSDGNKVSVELETVDGSMHPEVFLHQLSQHDGYEGVIDYSDKLEFADYYRVDVDEEGYGVYAYLCNYSEIIMASDYDTKLGELAYRESKGDTLLPDELKLLSHSATITLSAQKNKASAIPVSTLKSLQEVIAAGTAEIIQLSDNITIIDGAKLTIPADSHLMLDLNGHTITNMEGTAIKTEPGSSLTLINGSLKQYLDDTTPDAGNSCGIYAVGAEVVMSNVKLNEFQYGVYVGDHENSNVLDSRIHIVDSAIDAEGYAVFISGNGLLSEQKSQLIIENSTLSSENIVITGNGDNSGNGRWGTDIQIIDSVICGYVNDATGIRATGVYQPQRNSTLRIYSSRVEGYNGVAVKGGNVSIVGSTIIGMGEYNTPAFGGSGFTDTGDAVYVETNYGYEVVIEISGNSVLHHISEESKSLRIFEEDATNVSVQIKSGIFDEAQLAEHIAEGSAQMTTEDGKFVVTVQ